MAITVVIIPTSGSTCVPINGTQNMKVKLKRKGTAWAYTDGVHGEWRGDDY